MTTFETIWRFLVTSLTVWRLSRVLFQNTGSLRAAEAEEEDEGFGRFWFGRVTDLACWVSFWLSSQTTTWIAYGFAGVFLSWLGMAGISRLFLGAASTADGSLHWTPIPPESRGEDAPCVGCVDGMQARHG